MKKRILVACLIGLALLLLSYANDYTRKQIIKCVEDGGNPKECEMKIRR